MMTAKPTYAELEAEIVRLRKELYPFSWDEIDRLEKEISILNSEIADLQKLLKEARSK